jgi:hypothetical protein
MAFVALAAGCAEKPKPIAVAEGEVTIDGEPVDGGIISFIHAESEASAGGAAIAKGRYRLYPESGLAPGKYRVEIRWAKSTGEKVKEPVYGHSPYVFAEAIPGKYNSESALIADLSDGFNELHFRLEK